MSVYDNKPDQFLVKVPPPTGTTKDEIYCAGFELKKWRAEQLAYHLIEWLPEYALPEDELRMHHGNVVSKLTQAAVRVYTTSKYAGRGEVGEIAIHAICRGFFNTIPLSPRVFYKSATNEVIKAFDMVHVRFPDSDNIELWLGESKLYSSPSKAIGDAITSVKKHLEDGFLKNQKLLLGPQIPKTTPRYDEISKLFKSGTSLDELINQSVFVIGIACESEAALAAKVADQAYVLATYGEMAYLRKRLSDSGLGDQVRVLLIYVPLASKTLLVNAFDKRLKALQ